MKPHNPATLTQGNDALLLPHRMTRTFLFSPLATRPCNFTVLLMLPTCFCRAANSNSLNHSPDCEIPAIPFQRSRVYPNASIHCSHLAARPCRPSPSFLVAQE